jgi:rhodanese-related sulfurtransferase
MASTVPPTISVQELAQKASSGSEIDVIDVRTPVEYREVHCSYARNFPLESLAPTTVAAQRSDNDQPLYVICLSGARGEKACAAFAAAGITNVVNVTGGTRAWDAAGLPVVRGKKAVSLERQVRIAAGSLVLAGSTAGYFGPEYWIGLPAFVGAGLIFAGITDTCGMGMILAKMPWNQVSDASSTPQSCDRT